MYTGYFTVRRFSRENITPAGGELRLIGTETPIHLCPKSTRFINIYCFSF